MVSKSHWVVAVVCLLLVSAAFGQVAITGKITGVVEDPSGAAVNSATVTLEGPALMAARTTTAQTDGSYLFDFVPIGTYQLTIDAKGFRSFVQKDVQISSGFVATVSPHLRVEGSQEVEEVRAQAPVEGGTSVAPPTPLEPSLLP